jgi:hypothetical protein
MTITQKFTSALTSVKQVPALHKQYRLFTGKSVLDYGGGRYDLGINYLKDAGFHAEVFDPFNRSAKHNELVLQGQYDTVIISNVLNVIKEKSVRIAVITHAMELGKEVFCTVYYDRTKSEQETPKGYQMHKPTAFYIDEIMEAMPSAKVSLIKGKLIYISR